MDGGGVGATVTTTGAAWTVPRPVTASLNVYALVVVLVFAGTVTSCEMEPVVHGTVAERPAIAGVTENLHEAALPPTVADSERLPPVDGKFVADALRAETVGAADAWPTPIRNINPASKDA
jgi:hypothetical protein